MKTQLETIKEQIRKDELLIIAAKYAVLANTRKGKFFGKNNCRQIAAAFIAAANA